MLKNIFQVGSIFWRAREYGILPSQKYLKEKCFSSKNLITAKSYVTSLDELNKKTFRLGCEEIRNPKVALEEMDAKLHSELIKLKTLDSMVKYGPTNQKSFTRLHVLAYLVRNSNEEIVFETGT